MGQEERDQAGGTPGDDREVHLLINAGRLVEANILLDRQLSQALDGRDRELRSVILTGRAVMAWRLRRIPLALELAAEGWTDLDSEPTETPSTAQALGNLGYLMEGIGHSSAAIGLLRQSVELAREAGDPAVQAYSIQRLGGLLNVMAHQRGDDHALPIFAESRTLLAEGLELADQGLVPQNSIRAALLGAYAAALVGCGELEEGERTARHTIRLAAEDDNRWAIGVGNWVLSTIRLRQGRLIQARTLASIAVLEAERLGDTALLRLFSERLAVICAALEDPVGEVTALRRNVAARQIVMETLQEGLRQALEQRRVAIRARRLATAAQEAAVRDPLTGLVNRLGLERSAAERLERAGEPIMTPWLMLIDVDGFKEVNDAAGHAAGDATLREIAKLVRGACRAEDLIARWAGDEFVVLLCQSPEAGLSGGRLGLTVAERIRSAVHDHNWASVLGAVPGPTVSIGVATGNGDLNGLFTAADAALYRAKRQGRNRVESHRGTVAPATTR